MNILQVSTYDRAGGAEMIASRLMQFCRQQGFGAMMAVGTKFSNDEFIRVIPQEMPSGRWYGFWTTRASIARETDPLKERRFIRIAQPLRAIEHSLGIEDFYNPGTKKLLNLFQDRPDMVHCHNLHGPYNVKLMRAGFFDLRYLPRLSRQVPVLLTLHDAWLLSGHCAHSLDCDRWRIGCGHCPYLNVYPPLERDASAINWTRKRRIFSKSRLYVSTPSQWMMKKIEQSILARSILEARVIPNGIDLSIFQQADRQQARALLGFPKDTFILFTSANGIKTNSWKDYDTLKKAAAIVAQRESSKSVILAVLGETGESEQFGRLKILFFPFVRDTNTVALFYQSADVYIHPAKVETFPTTIIEALACGIPVIASSVGGIPEQIVDGITGLLVPPGNADRLAQAVGRLEDDNSLRLTMGAAAAEDATGRFDETKMLSSYINWYREIISRKKAKPS